MLGGDSVADLRDLSKIRGNGEAHEADKRRSQESRSQQRTKSKRRAQSTLATTIGFYNVVAWGLEMSARTQYQQH